MDIWNIDKLVLFIAFVIPGFLILKANAVLGLEPAADSSKQIVDAVAYSCVNYALLCLPILTVESSTLKKVNLEGYLIFYGFVILVAPLLWAVLWRWLRTTQFFQRVLPHPTTKPWDYVFRQRRRYWILITFKDGKQVAGRYDSRSFSSASPALDQIYLEQTWVVNADGGFERQRENSAGILVLGSEIRTIEFFNVLLGETNGDQADTNRSRSQGMAANTA